MEVGAFRALVEPWMRAEQRDLPWRSTRDPWAIHVAECMLQQTQVARVVPRWHAFLDRFPRVDDCAEAELSETVRLWDGLGYNRRAVQLHACAVEVTTSHGGIFPDRLESLLRLPGVGPYTARAILAFAFERDVAVLDTNVARVLARCVAGRPLGHRDAQELADRLVPVGSGWAWNQGMLDLGAVACMKRAPRCPQCPVRSVCRWQAPGCDGVAPDPAVGSAGVTGRQSRFEGSDRQLRGRLVAALRRGPLTDEQALGLLSDVSDVSDGARFEKVIGSLVDDGLVARSAGRVTLA